MHQFRAKDLQPLAQLFHQVVDIFFDVRSFAISITNVDIHAQASDHGRDSVKELRFLTSRFYTRRKRGKANKKTLS
jgi:hypothetical protein